MNRKSSYKDLEKYQATSRAQRKRYYAQFEKYPPKPFNSFQDSLIIAHSMPDRELSQLIEQSVAKIQKRRSYLKKRKRGLD